MDYDDLEKSFEKTSQLISDFLGMDRRNRETA